MRAISNKAKKTQLHGHVAHNHISVKITRILHLRFTELLQCAFHMDLLNSNQTRIRLIRMHVLLNSNSCGQALMHKVRHLFSTCLFSGGFSSIEYGIQLPSHRHKKMYK